MTFFHFNAIIEKETTKERNRFFMKQFLDKDFLLKTPTASTLFQAVAGLPIIDYHCHLIPQQIAENKRFNNITEIWLYGDHYKWRAMRSYGIDEYYITGEASDYEKFQKWAETVPYLIGNPLYHWTHLELQRFFGIYEPLSPATAEQIWNRANEIIAKDNFCVFEIFKKFNVEAVCTTDDPIDSLEYHQQIRTNELCTTKVLPTFRPDKALNIEREGFVEWVAALGEACSQEITDYFTLQSCLVERLLFFKSMGCVVTDHACDSMWYEDATFEEMDVIFKKGLRKESLTKSEIAKYKSNLLIFLGKKYSEYGFVMQLHMNVIRNNNKAMFKKLGPDTGFDSINDDPIAKELSQILGKMSEENKVPKTILYTLNPKDNYVIGTMLGNFQGGGVKGKLQFGSGWWFCDQKDGMQEQMKALANLGVLPTFVGMLTDSRSFLSYPRHEYFRRILCNLLGTWVEDGEYPNCPDLLKKIAKDISYYNAKSYFGL